MAAENEGVNVFDADFAFHGDESAHARGIENACHTEHAIFGEAADFHCGLGHGVQRIRDDDQDGVGGMLDDLFYYAFDYVEVGFKEIVAAHAGLAWESGGDDDDIAVGGGAVVTGGGGNSSGEGIGAGDGATLDHVEGFAGGRAVEDVGQDYVSEFEIDDALGCGGAYETTTDYCDFFAAHCWVSFGRRFGAAVGAKSGGCVGRQDAWVEILRREKRSSG